MGNAAGIQSPYILHSLCEEGNAELLHQVLSATTIDANRLDTEGYTPLARAVESGSTDCVRILLECGADPSIGDNMGLLLTAGAPISCSALFVDL
jgi:ankyrin repeat protein